VTSLGTAGSSQVAEGVTSFSCENRCCDQFLAPTGQTPSAQASGLGNVAGTVVATNFWPQRGKLPQPRPAAWGTLREPLLRSISGPNGANSLSPGQRPGETRRPSIKQPRRGEILLHGVEPFGETIRCQIFVFADHNATTQDFVSR
jgi:hypothetical protein